MKKAKLAAAFLILMIVLFRASEAVAGAQRAVGLWISSVAPALFPFLVLMPVLTGDEAGAIYRRLFSGVMQPLFGLPGEAAPAVVIGIIAGSPGGAIATAQIAGQSQMRRGQAWRIALAVSGVSPAFLIMGVGRGMYGSVQLGLRLAMIQLTIQLAMLLLLRGYFEEERETVRTALEERGDKPVQRAVENVLVICGYMVFFSMVGAGVADLAGANWGRFLLLLLDLPSGLKELSGSDLSIANLLLGAAIGFGGMCIGMQNLDVLKKIGLPRGTYFAARAIAAMLMGLACMWLLPQQSFSLLESLQNPKRICAFSILIALLLTIPVMISFSRKCFLNK